MPSVSYPSLTYLTFLNSCQGEPVLHAWCVSNLSLTTPTSWQGEPVLHAHGVSNPFLNPF